MAHTYQVGIPDAERFHSSGGYWQSRTDVSQSFTGITSQVFMCVFAYMIVWDDIRWTDGSF